MDDSHFGYEQKLFTKSTVATTVFLFVFFQIHQVGALARIVSID
jgi:hypothetical protein